MVGTTAASVEKDFSETVARVVALRARLGADPELGPRWLAVKAWQSERFTDTYADLLQSERYRLPCLFFLEDIYGTHDFEQRDTEVRKVLPRLARMLPLRALETLLLAFKLDEMSEQFDAELGRIIETPITALRYAEAYPLVASFEQRQQQIALAGRIGNALDRLARIPMLGALLGMMKGPAEAWGFGHLHRFLHRGFSAFAGMHGARDFLATINRRESVINRRLFAREPDPFRPIDGER